MEKRTHIVYGGVLAGFPSVAVSEVIAFIAATKYVEMFLDDGRSYLLPTIKENSLKALCVEFADEFTQVHRNSLVRLSKVTGYSLGMQSPHVNMHGDGKRIPVSRRHRKAVKQKLEARDFPKTEEPIP